MNKCRLNEDESALSDKIQREMDDIQKITNEVWKYAG